MFVMIIMSLSRWLKTVGRRGIYRQLTVVIDVVNGCCGEQSLTQIGRAHYFFLLVIVTHMVANICGYFHNSVI